MAGDTEKRGLGRGGGGEVGPQQGQNQEEAEQRAGRGVWVTTF